MNAFSSYLNEEVIVIRKSSFTTNYSIASYWKQTTESSWLVLRQRVRIIGGNQQNYSILKEMCVLNNKIIDSQISANIHLWIPVPYMVGKIQTYMSKVVLRTQTQTFTEFLTCIIHQYGKTHEQIFSSRIHQKFIHSIKRVY